MPVGLSDVQVVNAALEQVAAQTKITALNDGSPAANAAAVVYTPTVQFLLRDLEPDFARLQATLVAAAGAPPVGWSYWYTFPADCMRLLQVSPSAAVLATLDPYDPQPGLESVALKAGPSSVILSNQGPAALATYISSIVTEVQWDSAFADAVIRRLANPLAMALSGRPDFARELLEQSGMSGQTARATDDSMVHQ